MGFWTCKTGYLRVTDSVRVIIDQLSIGKSKTDKFTLQPFEINKTTSLLTITTTEKSIINSAALYILTGKCAGTFSQCGSTFTLDRKAVALNSRIFVVRVNLNDLHGGKRTISRLLLWQK